MKRKAFIFINLLFFSLILFGGVRAFAAFQQPSSAFPAGSPTPPGGGTLLETLQAGSDASLFTGTTKFGGALEVGGLSITGLGAVSAGLVLFSDDANGTVKWTTLSSELSPGTENGQTLRYNGFSWEISSLLLNSGALVAVGSSDVLLGITGPADLQQGTAVLRIADMDTGQNPELQFKYATGTSDHWAMYVNKRDNSLRLWGAGLGGADRMVFAQDGRVGIGRVPDVGVKLDVSGEFRAPFKYFYSKTVTVDRTSGMQQCSCDLDPLGEDALDCGISFQTGVDEGVMCHDFISATKANTYIKLQGTNTAGPFFTVSPSNKTISVRAGMSSIYALNMLGRLNATTGLCIGTDCKTSIEDMNQWVLDGESVYYPGGKVGIGAAPHFPLDVSGTVSTSPSVRLAHGLDSLWTGFRIDREKGQEKWFLGMENTTGDSTLLFRRGGKVNDLVISDNGFVGIGTKLPLTRLDILNTNDTQNAGIVFTNEFGQPGLALSPSGKVGVGTLSPESVLHVKREGSAVPRSLVYIEGSSKGDDSDTKNFFLRTRNTGETIPNSFIVRTDGRTGIGTAEPTGTVHLANIQERSDAASRVDLLALKSYSSDSAWLFGVAKVGSSDDSFQISNGGKGLTITNDGKIGVGTAAPAERLHVAGDMKLTSLTHDELEKGVLERAGYSVAALPMKNCSCDGDRDLNLSKPPPPGKPQLDCEGTQIPPQDFDNADEQCLDIYGYNIGTKEYSYKVFYKTYLGGRLKTGSFSIPSDKTITAGVAWVRGKSDDDRLTVSTAATTGENSAKNCTAVCREYRGQECLSAITVVSTTIDGVQVQPGTPVACNSLGAGIVCVCSKAYQRPVVPAIVKLCIENTTPNLDQDRKNGCQQENIQLGLNDQAVLRWKIADFTEGARASKTILRQNREISSGSIDPEGDSTLNTDTLGIHKIKIQAQNVYGGTNEKEISYEVFEYKKPTITFFTANGTNQEQKNNKKIAVIFGQESNNDSQKVILQWDVQDARYVDIRQSNATTADGDPVEDWDFKHPTDCGTGWWPFKKPNCPGTLQTWRLPVKGSLELWPKRTKSYILVAYPKLKSPHGDTRSFDSAAIGVKISSKEEESNKQVLTAWEKGYYYTQEYLSQQNLFFRVPSDQPEPKVDINETCDGSIKSKFDCRFTPYTDRYDCTDVYTECFQSAIWGDVVRQERNSRQVTERHPSEMVCVREEPRYMTVYECDEVWDSNTKMYVKKNCGYRQKQVGTQCVERGPKMITRTEYYYEDVSHREVVGGYTRCEIKKRDVKCTAQWVLTNPVVN